MGKKITDKKLEHSCRLYGANRSLYFPRKFCIMHDLTQDTEVEFELEKGYISMQVVESGGIRLRKGYEGQMIISSRDICDAIKKHFKTNKDNIKFIITSEEKNSFKLNKLDNDNKNNKG